MGVFRVFSMAAARWYVLVPLVLVSLGVAWVAYTQMPAVYTASAVYQVNVPADGAGSDTPFGDTRATAARLARDVAPRPPSRGQTAPPPYTVTSRADAPMIDLHADSNDPKTALNTVNSVSTKLKDRLAKLQLDSRVSPDAQLRLDVAAPSAVAPPVRTTGIRVFAATLVFGFMLSLVIAAAVERTARRRRDLLDEFDAEDYADDRESDDDSPDDEGRSRDRDREAGDGDNEIDPAESEAPARIAEIPAVSHELDRSRLEKASPEKAEKIPATGESAPATEAPSANHDGDGEPARDPEPAELVGEPTSADAVGAVGRAAEPFATAASSGSPGVPPAMDAAFISIAAFTALGKPGAVKGAAESSASVSFSDADDAPTQIGAIAPLRDGRGAPTRSLDGMPRERPPIPSRATDGNGPSRSVGGLLGVQRPVAGPGSAGAGNRMNGPARSRPMDRPAELGAPPMPPRARPPAIPSGPPSAPPCPAPVRRPEPAAGPPPRPGMPPRPESTRRPQPAPPGPPPRPVMPPRPESAPGAPSSRPEPASPASESPRPEPASAAAPPEPVAGGPPPRPDLAKRAEPPAGRPSGASRPAPDGRQGRAASGLAERASAVQPGQPARPPLAVQRPAPTEQPPAPAERDPAEGPAASGQPGNQPVADADEHSERLAPGGEPTTPMCSDENDAPQRQPNSPAEVTTALRPGRPGPPPGAQPPRPEAQRPPERPRPPAGQPEAGRQPESTPAPRGGPVRRFGGPDPANFASSELWAPVTPPADGPNRWLPADAGQAPGQVPGPSARGPEPRPPNGPRPPAAGARRPGNAPTGGQPAGVPPGGRAMSGRPVNGPSDGRPGNPSPAQPGNGRPGSAPAASARPRNVPANGPTSGQLANGRPPNGPMNGYPPSGRPTNQPVNGQPQPGCQAPGPPAPVQPTAGPRGSGRPAEANQPEPNYVPRSSPIGQIRELVSDEFGWPDFDEPATDANPDAQPDGDERAAAGAPPAWPTKGAGQAPPDRRERPREPAAGH